DQITNQARLSLDGQMIQETISSDYLLTSGTIYIGCNEDQSQPWSGLLDELSFWLRPLSKREMAQLHMQVGHTFTVALNNDTQTPKRELSIRDAKWSERYESQSAGGSAYVDEDGQEVEVDGDAVESYDEVGVFEPYWRKTKDGYVQFNSDTSKSKEGYITVDLSITQIDLVGCTDPDACNFDGAHAPQPGISETESNAQLCHYPDANAHSNRCWTEDADALQNGAMSLAVDLNSDGDAFPEYDLNEGKLSPERNGCQDPTACNFDDHATDDYPMFTGWDHLGVSGDSRFFITRDAMARDEAIALATEHGCTLAQLDDENEALMVGFKSNWTEAWTDIPLTLDIEGVGFTLLGSVSGKSYYYSTAANNPRTLEHTRHQSWNRIRRHLVQIESSTENSEILGLLQSAQNAPERLWLGITDRPDAAFGEGQWNHMRDDSGLAADAYLNWVIDPNTLSTPQHVIP
ncbi:MAG: LamG-like jellyroll fold domain-containing protein, partial [Flavobacteriales bacterium]